MVDTKCDTKYNGGEKMSSWDKLLKRFLELDYDIRFEEIVKVIEEEMKENESRTQLLHESSVSYGNC